MFLIIQLKNIIIYENEIVGVGKYNKAKEIYNLKGYYASPGLIDSHIHIESTFLTPGEFAKTFIPQGTLCVIADPHEIANVSGIRGIKYILNASKIYLWIYFLCYLLVFLHHLTLKIQAQD